MTKVKTKVKEDLEKKETESKKDVKIKDPKFVLGKDKDPKEKRKENLERKKKLAEEGREEIDLFSLEKRM